MKSMLVTSRQLYWGTSTSSGFSPGEAEKPWEEVVAFSLRDCLITNLTRSPMLKKHCPGA